jgi:hypothetical protein
MEQENIPSVRKREYFSSQQKWEQEECKSRDEPEKMLRKEKELKCK